MKKLLIILLFYNLVGHSQNVDIQIKAPKAVEVGEQFQVVYEVNDNVTGFENTSFPDFDLLGGPSQSKSHQIISNNGKIINEVNISFSYYLRAKKVGKFTVNPIAVVVGGKKYKSKPLVIEVVASSNGNASTGNTNKNNSAAGSSTPQAGNTGTGETFGGIFANKSTLYIGEPILVSLKVFSANEIVDIPDFKESNFTGFYKNKIDLGQLKLTQDKYNGKSYYSVLLQKNILFPQQTGELSLTGFSLSPVLRFYKTRRATSQIEAMMYGSYTIREAENKSVKIKSPNLKIKVLPLPEAGKPTNFNGVVGAYEIKSYVDRTSLGANDAFTMKIVVSGRGNLDLLQIPDPNFPSDFEVYEPKVTTNIDVTVAGVSGSKTYEYLVIPRTEGTYKIPSLSFSFFNHEKKSYQSASTDEYEIKVSKGTGSAFISNGGEVSSKEINYLNKDINYIKTNELTVNKIGNHLFNSILHWIILILIPIATFVLLFAMRKRMKENMDVMATKNRRANMVARKRLKMASKYLSEKNETEFYNEISRVLWGYFGDKFSIVLSELSVDNVKIALTEKNLDSTIIIDVVNILEECEFARFAPSKSDSRMNEIFEKASAIISKTEKTLK